MRQRPWWAWIPQTVMSVIAIVIALCKLIGKDGLH